MKVFEIKDAFGIDNLVLAERPKASPGLEQILIRIRGGISITVIFW